MVHIYIRRKTKFNLIIIHEAKEPFGIGDASVKIKS